MCHELDTQSIRISRHQMRVGQNGRHLWTSSVDSSRLFENRRQCFCPVENNKRGFPAFTHTHTHTRENSRFVQLIYYIPTIVIERLRAWLAQVGEHGSQLLVKTKNRHLQKVTQRSIYLSLCGNCLLCVCVTTVGYFKPKIRRELKNIIFVFCCDGSTRLCRLFQSVVVYCAYYCCACSVLVSKQV